MSYWELDFYSRLLLCLCNSWELECLPGYSTGSQATSWLMKLVYSIHHLKGTLWIFWINKNGLLNHFSFSLAEWFSRVSMEGSFFNALGSVQRFATKISWNTNYQYRLNKLHLCTVSMRSCVTYINWFMVCPFFLAFVTPLPPLTLIPLTLTNLSLHVPSSHTNAYYYSFICDAVCTWNSLPYSVMSLPSLKRTVSNYLQLLLCWYCIVPYSWVRTHTY